MHTLPMVELFTLLLIVAVFLAIAIHRRQEQNKRGTAAPLTDHGSGSVRPGTIQPMGQEISAANRCGLIEDVLSRGVFLAT